MANGSFRGLSAIEGGSPLAEAAVNPIMLPGDHGPVAYRNLYIKEWK